MILQAIEVKGWRCFANVCRLGEFGPGINIVHAPNAAGKSTMFESLQRGLFDAHKVGGDVIAQLKSWGRDLAPSVQIDFKHRGSEYRLVKRFLRERAAQIYRRENGRYVLKAEGESADLEARTIFSGEPAGRGPAREQHWGLAQVLWAPQGKLACSELPRGLINSIRGALDLQAADSASGAIEREIEALYLEVYSPNGKVRRGGGAPEWIRSAEKLVQLRDERRAWEIKGSVWHEASSGVEEHRRARQLALEEEKVLQGQLDQVRLELAQFHKAQARAEKGSAQAAQHAARHRELNGRIQAIAAKRAELDLSREEAARLAQEIPRLTERVKACATTVERCEQTVARVREAHTHLEARRRDLHAAEQFVALTTAVDRLDQLLARVRAIDADLQKARARHANLKSLDDATLQKIREAIRGEVQAHARLEAAAVTLQITLDHAGRIEVLSGDLRQEPAPAVNEFWQIKDLSEVVVRLPGVGEIKAFGSIESAAGLKADLQAASAKVAVLTEAFGTADLAKLEQQHDDWRRSAAELVAQERRLQGLLGEQTVALITAEKAAHEKSLARLTVVAGVSGDAPPDLAYLKQDLEERIKTAPDAEEAYKRSREAELNLFAVQKELAVAESRFANATGRVSRLEQEIGAAPNDGLDDAGRAEALARIALEWSAAVATADDAKRELVAFTDDPAARLRALEQRSDFLWMEAERHLSAESRARERLDSLGELAPFSALAKLDEEMTSLEESVSREKLQAEAIRMLHETVKKCRSEALTNVSALVEAQALEIFHRIAGDPQVGAMHLGETFRLEQVSPASYGEPVPLENLSGGEKEQVHLAVRLALALVLAREERQLVVLDDVLIATDAVRLQRILDLFEDVARHLQIIILTCHPERYRRLGDAQFFDLEKIKLA